MNWKLICISGALLCAVNQSQAIATADVPSSGRAALVNGVLISRADFLTELKRIERLRGVDIKAPDPVETARLKKESMENLITRELLYQEAGKQGIKVTDAEVGKEVGGLKKQFANDSEFGTTLGQMGLSEESVKAQIGRGMTIRRFIDDRFGKKVKVSDADVDYYYADHQDEFRAAGGQQPVFQPLSEVRDRIRQKIREERINRELSPYVRRLRETAKVEILLDEGGD